MTKISFDDVKTVLEELARLTPDRTADCYYSLEAAAVLNGEEDLGDEWDPMLPCCIVGTVVHILHGLDGLKQLRENLSVDMYQVTDDAVTYNVRVLRVLGYSDEAIVLLARVQNYQDRGQRWATAVENALASIENGVFSAI